MELLEALVPLITLIFLEVILGIDNIIFIAILADKLPPEKRDKLRLIGISLAMIMRLLLLTVIIWIMKLTQPFVTILNNEISGKDLILLAGGIFLIYKSVKEIYQKTETKDTGIPLVGKAPKFSTLLIEILILDMVFSIDSIITAVGMVDELWVMYTAVVVAVIVMLFASKPIVNFITKHPSFKILALCFLLIIGISLIAEGFNFHIPKAYIYLPMAFAFIVDLIQMKTIKNN